MSALVILVSVTLLYASYNLFVKVSSDHVPDNVTSTVLATICLQFSALILSILFALYLLSKGNQTLHLNLRVYSWAALAGLCIGAAEIGYFYLFGTFVYAKSIPANIVIPTVVSGTVVITLLVSYFIFGELMSPIRLFGAILAIVGIVIIYAGKQA